MTHSNATSLSEELQATNKAIEKVYFKILKEIAELSKSFEDPDLRFRIEIDLKHYPKEENEVFELLTSYMYLVLNRNDGGQLKIGYAVNDTAIRHLGHLHYNKLLRIIYANTKPKPGSDECLEVFPYYSDIYEEARHFASGLEEEDPHYKLVLEDYKAR
ncbi:hypothetical protein GZH53_15830 [Flavihumibacter sp. R14]|nr:hypothetical protein [Flavihumibacter soli]